MSRLPSFTYRVFLGKLGAGIFILAPSFLLNGCAQYSSDIAPSAISDARYENWGCQKLAKEKAFVDDALARASAAQDKAAGNDAMMVFIVGVPTSGGGIKEQVASLKGQQIALHTAQIHQGCTY